MKDKKLPILLLLALITVPVGAIQDINLTLDTGGIGLCLAVGNLTNYICAANQTLVVDGTRDYEYYILPEQTHVLTLASMAHEEGLLESYIMSPFTLVVALISIILPMVLGAVIVYMAVTVLFRRSRKYDR